MDVRRGRLGAPGVALSPALRASLSIALSAVASKTLQKGRFFRFSARDWSALRVGGGFRCGFHPRIGRL